MFTPSALLLLLAIILQTQCNTTRKDCYDHCSNGRHFYSLKCTGDTMCQKLCEDDANVCQCNHRSGVYTMPCQTYYTQANECSKFCSNNNINRPTNCDDFPNQNDAAECSRLCEKDKRGVCRCGKFPGKKYEIMCPLEPVKVKKCDDFCDEHKLFGKAAKVKCEDLPEENMLECYLVCHTPGKCRCQRDTRTLNKVTLTCPDRKSPDEDAKRESIIAGIVVGVLFGVLILVIIAVFLGKLLIKKIRAKKQKKLKEKESTAAAGDTPVEQQESVVFEGTSAEEEPSKATLAV